MHQQTWESTQGKALNGKALMGKHSRALVLKPHCSYLLNFYISVIYIYTVCDYSFKTLPPFQVETTHSSLEAYF